MKALQAIIATTVGAACCVGAMAAPAVDLTKVDRSIKKEPVYQTKSPAYCLLVFGPEAKTRVWLVRDGSMMYVDRNANGDLTETGKRVRGEEKRPKVISVTPGEEIDARTWSFQLGEISEGEDKPTHTELLVELEHYRHIPKTGKPWIDEDTHITLRLGGKQVQSVYGNFQFAARPEEAPVIHLNGPLTMKPLVPGMGLALKRGEGIELRTVVGTPGLGEDTFAWWNNDAVPKEVNPIAEIEYPNKDRGGKPILVQYVLSQRC